MRSIRALLLTGVLVAGCSSKPLQDPDASGSGGVGVLSIDAATDSPPSIDVAPDLPADAGLPFTGRRSFVGTSMLGHDGGSTVPASHGFTLVLDADQRTLLYAMGTGEGVVVPIEPTVTGGVHVVGGLRFAVSCSGSVTYDDLTFTLGPTGNLTGTGRGQFTIFASDGGMTTNVTMSLTGVPDTEAPRLTVNAMGDLTDPFTLFSLIASEPLPPGANVLLASASGETIPLSSNAGGFATQFAKPFLMLRYGERYLITTGVWTDFAGNAVGGGLETFTTAAPPPVAAEDGFESLTGTTFGGAQVLSSPDSVLTGTRSLYVPPGSTASGAARSLLLVLRVALAPGDTAIRFAYRTVGSGSGSAPFLLGITGGKIVFPVSPPDSTTVTTPGTIAGSVVSLGPLMTATFALPAGAEGEAVLRRSVLEAPCGLPALPVPGIIIDDLRAE